MWFGWARAESDEKSLYLARASRLEAWTISSAIKRAVRAFAMRLAGSETIAIRILVFDSFFLEYETYSFKFLRPITDEPDSMSPRLAPLDSPRISADSIG
jgi:hypothetical protein